MDRKNVSFVNASGFGEGYDANVTQAQTHIDVEYEIATTLVKYGLIFIIVFGTIGNVLSFLVLTRKRMRHTSVNFYLACLACADTAVLYFSGFKTWLRLVSGFEMLHASAVACKTILFIFAVAMHISAWLVVLITFDRFIVVWFPLKANTWCSVTRSRICACVMTVVAFIYPLHLFWNIHLLVRVDNNGQEIKHCTHQQSDPFMASGGPYEYMKLITYSLIPFTIVVCMNVSIIIRIRQNPWKGTPNGDGQTYYRNGALYSGQGRQHNQGNKHQMTVMLLVVSFVWLVLSMPFALFSVIPYHFYNTNHSATFLAKTCCFLMMYSNHSVNFLLYCIAGGKFRKELLQMFKDVKYVYSRHSSADFG